MSKNTDREFTKLAVKFVLGIVVGFALVLMGVVFFMIGILATGVESYSTPASTWFIATAIFESVGIWIMYKTLQGSPEPGTLSDSGKYRGKDRFF